MQLTLDMAQRAGGLHNAAVSASCMICQPGAFSAVSFTKGMSVSHRGTNDAVCGNASSTSVKITIPLRLRSPA